MSSIGDEDIDDTGATGVAKIDGLLGQYHWSLSAQDIMSFSIPDDYDDYEDTREGLIDDYPDSNAQEVFAMPNPMVLGILKSAEEFEKIVTFRFKLDDGDQETARIRYGITDFTGGSDSTRDAPAYAYMPDDEDGITDIDTQNWMSGDVFFNEDKFTAADPQVGSYAYHTILHETGHAMGLKHGHDAKEFDDDSERGPLPRHFDCMDFTVMTYRSYVDAETDAYSNPEGNYAQTLMMLDIAALQSMYGADYGTEKGDTTYSWNAKDGSYAIDGDKQWTPIENVVYMTIWDGGGVDTYDLSNYKSDILVNLHAGADVNFGSQIADLGDKENSRANVFNALLFDDDVRSLIENVTTGSGDDRALGNEAANRIEGGAGDDTLLGDIGDDTLIGDGGGDDLNGGVGHDFAGYVEASGVDVAIKRLGPAADGAWAVTGLKEGGGDGLKGVEGFIFGAGDDRVTVAGSPTVDLYGQGGDDTLEGGDGAQLLVGGRGTDRMIVGDGLFEVFGGGRSLFGASIQGDGENDTLVIDRSGLKAGYGLFNDVPGSGEFFDRFGSEAHGVERIEYSGGKGDDAVAGGFGNDQFFGGAGRNLFNGFDGDDLALGSGTFRGGDGRDTIFGDGDDDFISGDAGDDTLRGGGGSDRLDGGDGNDHIETGRGDDVGVEGGDGNDEIKGSVDDEDMNGETGNDTLLADKGDDFLDGAADDDLLDGGAGDDEIQGGGGTDRIVGGEGEDDLSGGDGSDRFVFLKAFGKDTISDFDSVPKDGQDLIDLRGFGFDGFQDFRAHVDIKGGSTTFLNFGAGATLTLDDVAKSSIDAGDFLF